MMRLIFASLMTVAVSPARAEVGYAINCVFATTDKARAMAESNFVQSGQGLEVRSLADGVQLAFDTLNSGDLNRLKSQTLSTVTLNVISPLRFEREIEGATDSPFRACVVAEGEVLERKLSPPNRP